MDRDSKGQRMMEDSGDGLFQGSEKAQSTMQQNSQTLIFLSRTITTDGRNMTDHIDQNATHVDFLGEKMSEKCTKKHTTSTELQKQTHINMHCMLTVTIWKQMYNHVILSCY